VMKPSDIDKTHKFHCTILIFPTIQLRRRTNV
jgi:hypothetical protein